MTAELHDRIAPHTPDTRRHPWVPALACPGCGAPLDGDEVGPIGCGSCGRSYLRRDGVLALLTAERASEAEPFLQQYRLVREREGHRSAAPAYYRRLPYVASEDPGTDEWRLRRESYATLLRHGLSPVWPGPLRILDLGAGCGWLSHQLAAIGHDLVAVDYLDDGEDGLRVARHYEVAFTTVQADFDALPFGPAQFDLAIFNASLHYAPDPAATLASAARMLKPGGALVVMDSPMFAREHDGEAMVADLARRLASEHGLTNVISPGPGFLTFAGVERALDGLGRQSRFYRSRGVLPWRFRRQFARLKLRRPQAAFGVWVAR